jgi:hypothetical protein
MDDPDLWLAMKLVELAESVDVGRTEHAWAAQLTESLTELLAPAEIGLMLADQAGRLTAAAASSREARELLSFESDRQEGPCTDCAAKAWPVLNEDVGAVAARRPGFARAARAAGFGVVSALPMRRPGLTIGVVGVFSPGGQQLSQVDANRVQVLARAAAAAISTQREIQLSAAAVKQLQQALDSRVLIEQAKGAIATRLDITPDAAFGLLRAFARRNSRLLADVAGQIIAGELPVQELFALRQGAGLP